MSWIKIDDSLAFHPKISRLNDAQFRFYITALCYAGRHLTDGLVFVEALPRTHPSVIRKLVEVGLFEKTAKGLEIHDFLDFQRSRAEVETLREKKREAGAKGGKKSAETRKQTAEHSAQADAKHAGSEKKYPEPRVQSQSKERVPSSLSSNGEVISEEVGVAPKTPALARPLAGPVFPVAGKPATWQAPEDLLADLRRLYPGVDVGAELDKAAAKIRVNAVSRKTARGMPKFLHAWMERTQNSARPTPRPTGPPGLNGSSAVQLVNGRYRLPSGWWASEDGRTIEKDFDTYERRSGSGLAAAGRYVHESQEDGAAFYVTGASLQHGYDERIRAKEREILRGHPRFADLFPETVAEPAKAGGGA